MVEAGQQQPEDEAPRRRSSVFEILSLPEIQMPSINRTTNKNKQLHQYQTVNNRPRWLLHLQAEIWRFLMGIGMFLHRLAPPRPPKPNFYRTIDSTIAGIKGQITLHFYVPSDFNSQKKTFTARPGVFGDEEAGTLPERGSAIRRSIGSISGAMRRRSSRGRRWGGYPVVINFHGGGFTLGSPYDDARWCGTVVQQLNAIVVSVDYRLAPEHPFPTAVEDGVDAVIWIHKHAAEFGIDTDKIVLSGFSSGANMAFTVPLRLYDEQTGFRREEGDVVVKEGANAGKTLDTVQEDSETAQKDGKHARDSSASHSGSSSSTKVPPEGEILDPRDPPPSKPPNPTKTTSMVHTAAIPELPEIKIRCIVPWYPSLDYTRTREERRATCVRADQELPSLFTNLFDDSYLHPPKDVSLDSPYLSPGVAATDLLRNALPTEIIMHTCEWDMLLDEGQAFYQRLSSKEIGKHVNYTMVPGVPHGWDKAPNPWKPTPGVKEHYLKACKAMKAVLGQRDGRDPSEGPNADAPRQSSMVR